jgi:hypothetical protein
VDNGVLNFTKDPGDGSIFFIWDGNQQVPQPNYPQDVISPLSFQNSWVMDVDVTNNASTTDGFVNIGLEVATSDLKFLALFLSRDAGGADIRLESTDRTLVTFADLGSASTQDIGLRMAWDAGAGLLTTSYSTDGTSYQTIGAPLDALAAFGGILNDGFRFDLFANSVGQDAVGLGEVYADNFSVIPEPQTVGLLGLGGLGLFIFLRRRSRKAA